MINYSEVLNPTVSQIKPSGIRKFFDIAATMDDVISLGVGEPDFQTPWLVRKAGIASLERGKTKYTSNKGLEPLCSEISKYTKRKYNVEYDPQNEILVTVGGSEAIDVAIRALVCPGDEVIIPQPSYVCYEPMAAIAGAVPVIIETRAQDDFKLTPELLRAAITPRTKALILPYPCNPTGAIMERDDLLAIAEVLRDTNIIVISDEIYSELTFGGERHVSIASIDGMRERTILVNGFSKAFSMTGWRLGFACGPKEIMSQLIKIHQFAIMCAPTTSQYAAVEALRSCDDAVADMVKEYDRRRRLMVSGFNKLGLTCREPKGAFYAFPSISSTGLSSDEFCEKLLKSKKVAVVPGTAFGKGGEGFVRASYCYSAEHIIEALRRIGEFIEELDL
ncbi:MAG: aminotransferase class I/II-fold pyridoxal phosphate-dependent enzyme [Clostridia bacterium]|nr:aminotransferase class I/II-fold pyridoxal phosphate-dependent enzyme [Clostridia bacterium]MBQ2315879.1 aminotransferase class I/II-fold pyridoxal phosphate-dependent enzyme [Clostridia bacterium]MEE0808152.1 aminotransferase class I/II-fold pyridoxal phosphate-dependent enzyme [Acutalibacteraceae bacterium]